ncbi:MAG: Ig domain-containing protein [Sandaracinaceae bacterium]
MKSLLCRHEARGIAWGLGATALLLALGPGCGGSPADGPAIVIMGRNSVVVGETVTLMASTDEGMDTVYTWGTRMPAVATVTPDGTVTGMNPGETVITATGGTTGAVGAHVMVVIPAEVPVVAIGAPAVSVAPGATLQLSAETSTFPDESHTWTTDDDPEAMDPTALVDGTGLVTGVRPGEVVITATGDDSGASGSITLLVTPEPPFFEAWRSSAHADPLSPAVQTFVEAGNVRSACAQCHSTPGFLDYLGIPEGGITGFPASCAEVATITDIPNLPQADQDVPPGSLVECVACHNATTAERDLAIFPSRGDQMSELEVGEEAFAACVDNAGGDATCLACHQGLASSDAVVAAILNSNGLGPDQPPDPMGMPPTFLRDQDAHFGMAGAIAYGAQARPATQYLGRGYDWRVRHAEGVETCTGCHDPHSLEVDIDECASCHSSDGLGGWSPATDELRDIRASTSLSDYDGDGDTSEGIADEIDGLLELLYRAIQTYSVEAPIFRICFDEATGNWFVDDDESAGPCDEGETEAYSSWTPRLLGAAVTYETVRAARAAYVHNPRYAIQTVFDAILSINAFLDRPVNIAGATRNETGHLDGTDARATAWTSNAAIDPSCAGCHGGADGFQALTVAGGGQEVLERAEGIDCAVCHAAQGRIEMAGGMRFALRDLEAAVFPNGVRADLQVEGGDRSSNMCASCHAGRTAGAAVEAAIAGAEPDDDDALLADVAFLDIHALPSGATWGGSVVQAGVTYPGRTYTGTRVHPGGSSCVTCHAALAPEHSFEPGDIAEDVCAACHTGADNAVQVRRIRGAFDGASLSHGVDYDGDGFDGVATTPFEALRDEIGRFTTGENPTTCAVVPPPQGCGLSDRLLVEMQGVARDAGRPLCYAPDVFPYFFRDTNDDRRCDAVEASPGNAYDGSFTPRLLRAAYNYRLSQADPGGWAHNFEYVGQLLYDAIEDLGGDVSAIQRP